MVTETKPNDFTNPNADYIGGYGLTKREYFAAIALQGLLSNLNPIDFKGGEPQMHAHAVVTSVELSDALIEQLNA
jgi:hypothetical protein